MNKFFKISLVLAVALVSKACDDTPEKPPVKPVEGVTKKEVIANYAKIVHQNYKDSYDSAVKMQGAITAFTQAPSAETLETAKKEWIAARDIYSLTEVYRGSGGPIDTEGSINNEGQMNAWPLNEAYIDYVESKESYTGTYDVSIIGGTEVINQALLVGANQTVGEDDDAKERAVSTGWHAVEFLLWGQDNTAPSEKKAGLRPFTDYTTKGNKERRAKYLTVVTQLLVDDLGKLVSTWKVGGAYYKEFMALDEKVALNNILNGPYFLASFELSNERVLGAAVSSDGLGGSGQEDEHSCFSDNTHRDIYQNAQGIANVLTGKYSNISGASPLQLITQIDAVKGAALKAEIEKMMVAIKVIDSKAKSGTPFDLMIVNEGEDNPGIVLAGDKALKDLSNVIKEGAAKLDVTTVNGEE